MLTAFFHTGVPRELIIRLKYSGEKRLSSTLAGLALCSWHKKPAQGDSIVPVPVSHSKMRSRGFNQTLLIAREIEKLTGARVVRFLRRASGSSQVGSTAGERKRNVSGAFLPGLKSIPSGRIWLLDDVMTTGATMREACTVLSDAGAEHFHPAVVCFRNTQDESIIDHKEVADEGVE